MSFTSVTGRGSVATALVLCIASSGASVAHATESTADRQGLAALDYGFKFASAIETDPKGKGAAQTGIILAYLKRGAVDEAMKHAGSVEGWWRGVALAEVAVELAGEGRQAEARELVRRAEEVRQTVSGWENTRISSHVAHALALLGDLESSREAALKAAEADPREYLGQSVATVAEGYAVKGEFDRAMAELAVLEGDEELMTTWWRTSGYIEISRKAGLSDEQRVGALMAAAASAKTVPGWRQVDALRLVAEELHVARRHAEAVAALDAAEKMIGPDGGRATRPPTLLAEIASSWTKVGEQDRARALLVEAEQAALRLPIIDQPGLYARIATAYLDLEDETTTQRVLDTAIDRAEKLTNARPRALAVVEICRQTGIHGRELSRQDRARLDALLEGLGDPW